MIGIRLTIGMMTAAVLAGASIAAENAAAPQTPQPATGAGQAAPAAPPRPTPPTRDPHAPGYVTATELPDGAVPRVDAEGNFIIGPTHSPAPEMTAQDSVPQGTVITITMES